MLNKKLLGGAMFATALTGGALAGAVLGVPVVSSAQTTDDGGATTTVPSDSSDSSESSDSTTDTTTDSQGTDDTAGRNCPEKEATGS
jgi:hypothetical protein